MKTGDIVARKDGRLLRSGAEAYPYAIVIQVSPLVLVSEGTDMRWETTVQDVEFDVIGSASMKTFNACMKRL